MRGCRRPTSNRGRALQLAMDTAGEKAGTQESIFAAPGTDVSRDHQIVGIGYSASRISWLIICGPSRRRAVLIPASCTSLIGCPNSKKTGNDGRDGRVRDFFERA
jgi:hypothetical protein